MSEPTLRDAINNMPDCPMKTLYEQVLVLRLMALMPKCDERTPWHLTPDFEKFKDMCHTAAGKIEAACDDLCLNALRIEALKYEGKP